VVSDLVEMASHSLAMTFINHGLLNEPGLRNDLVYRRDGMLALKNPSYLMGRTRRRASSGILDEA
jgi:hypothetical protein